MRETGLPNFDPVEKGKAVDLLELVNYSRIFEARKNSNVFVKEIAGEDLEKVAREYKFLRADFGDLFPENQLVIAGKNRETARAYILMDKVEQVGLTKENEQNFFAGLDSMVASVVDYYATNLISDEAGQQTAQIPDIQTKNLIFGITAKNPDPRFYCVDNYPAIKLSRNDLLQIVSELVNSYYGRYGFPKIRQALEGLSRL